MAGRPWSAGIIILGAVFAAFEVGSAIQEQTAAKAKADWEIAAVFMVIMTIGVIGFLLERSMKR